MDKEAELKKLGARLRFLRLQRNLTQQSLAFKIGKDHPVICNIENGKLNPSYYLLLELCSGLEIGLNELVVSDNPCQLKKVP